MSLKRSAVLQLPKLPRKAKLSKKCDHGPANTYIINTPLGEIFIVSCSKGLHCIGQEPNITDGNFKPNKKCKVELVSQSLDDKSHIYTPALDCIQWMKNYFARESNQKMPALCPSLFNEGSFTTKVWQGLPEAAPFGTTISYKGLSLAIGGPEAASRAVGQAMATNPILLVIPCHRVIRSDGSYGNYAMGTRNTVKKWLLQFEQGED